MSDEFLEAGKKRRREILGDAHVDRAEADATPFTEPFQEYITRSVWGSIWTRPGLDDQTRRYITLSVLTALGREGELALHIRAALDAGMSQEELTEVFLQTGAYAGVPAANAAFALAKRLIEERA
jgi:4-carboxymuconolactone decarboxylase